MGILCPSTNRTFFMFPSLASLVCRLSKYPGTYKKYFAGLSRLFHCAYFRCHFLLKLAKQLEVVLHSRIVQTLKWLYKLFQIPWYILIKQPLYYISNKNEFFHAIKLFEIQMHGNVDYLIERYTHKLDKPHSYDHPVNLGGPLVIVLTGFHCIITNRKYHLEY